MIDRYTISDTPQGLVRTVIVTEAQTGEQVSLRLASTCLLSLFVQYQPHPGERIDVRYRWHAPDHGYQRWRLLMDRPEKLDFPLWGGSIRRGTLVPGATREPTSSQDRRRHSGRGGSASRPHTPSAHGAGRGW